MAQSQEYLKREFMHYIGDTIALLGADENFVKKIKAFEEMPLTNDLIEEVRRYNCLLIDHVKNRIALTNKIEIKNA